MKVVLIMFVVGMSATLLTALFVALKKLYYIKKLK